MSEKWFSLSSYFEERLYYLYLTFMYLKISKEIVDAERVWRSWTQFESATKSTWLMWQTNLDLVSSLQ